MEHEGMVHALTEIRRVLVSGGVLVDLRPLSIEFKPAVEMVANGRAAVVGLLDEPDEDPDDLASNAAMAQVEREGLFAREREASFLFATYWDSVDEMKEYIDENWVASLPQDVCARATRLMARAGAGAKVRARRNIVIARWRKLP